ncbi:MAG: hypothetical protein WCN98_09060 [Verrucomicrobiaceae bacterium]|uniref:hypothetical protein n=1 Tax=Aestuariivirga sp. TaxID=2650926 RepID=UPI00301A4ADC
MRSTPSQNRQLMKEHDMTEFRSRLRIAATSLLLVAAVNAASAGTADCNRIVVTGHPR